MSRIPSLLLALVLLTPAIAVAGQPTYPTLSSKDAEKLADGKLILMKESAGDETMVTGLLEIEATPETIWSIVLDNDHIVASSKAVKQVTTYHDVVDPTGLRDLRIQLLMKVGFSEIVFHSHRTVNVSDNWLSWHLDDAKDNDIKATDGSYSLWPGSRPGTLVFVYKARIETGKRVPEWLEEELTESSLKKFLIYVKDVAEG